MAWNGHKHKPKVGVCKDCIKRELGCHSTCEKYINAKKEWETEKNKIYVEKGKTADYDNYHFEAVRKRKATKDRKAMHKGKR